MMKIFHLHLLFNTVLSERSEESHHCALYIMNCALIYALSIKKGTSSRKSLNFNVDL